LKQPTSSTCRYVTNKHRNKTIRTRSSAIAVIADRTACSILTLLIVIATPRPLNKKSVCCQSADPTITADLHLVDKRGVPFRLPA